MKFIPRHNEIIGRMLIMKSESKIILSDPTKVTKFVLVDAVGPDALAKGIKPGDIIVPKELGHFVLDRGTFYRPRVQEEHAVSHVTDVTNDQLLMQTSDGREYVPFDSPNAAKPLGAMPAEWKTESEAA